MNALTVVNEIIDFGQFNKCYNAVMLQLEMREGMNARMLEYFDIRNSLFDIRYSKST